MSPDIPYSPDQNNRLAGLKPQAFFSRFINWAKSSKKRLLIALSVIVLIILIILLGWSAIKSRFFPSSDIPSLFENPAGEDSLPASMQLNTSKSAYNLSETIPVSLKATSSSESITGFDAVIEYDSEFLTLSKQNPPSLSEFAYYGKNTNKLIRISAVRKIDAALSQAFDNTELFSLEFTPKKAGQTTLKIIYMPGSFSDSNLINNDTKDTLGNVRGLEITIN